MDLRANPAPLGLMGFGMTTVLLNLHNAGFFGMDDLIVAMGLFYGGLAQVLAGTMEFRRGNTFGTTAFTSYGLFWLSLVYIIIAGNYDSLTVGNDTAFMGWYLIMWALFTAGMFFGTLRKNRALQVVFGSLTVLFMLLAVGHWADNETVIQVAGYEGIFCGLSAVYLAIAEVLNESLGMTVLPIGEIARPARESWRDEMPPLEPTVPHPMEHLFGGDEDDS
jgi:succinate-acetate transporter protein